MCCVCVCVLHMLARERQSVSGGRVVPDENTQTHIYNARFIRHTHRSIYSLLSPRAWIQLPVHIAEKHASLYIPIYTRGKNALECFFFFYNGIPFAIKSRTLYIYTSSASSTTTRALAMFLSERSDSQSRYKALSSQFHLSRYTT